MYKILTLNKISNIGLAKLSPELFDVSDKETEPEGIILRSYDMHSYEMPESLLAIARAGAGTNNIPIEKCSEKGIVVFNTPGANANAVKELVIAALLMSSRKIIDGIIWAKTLKGEKAVPKLVEAGKGQFVGPEIMGKKLGVIGLGTIGVLTANAGESLGMDVVGYDPFMTLESAWHLSRKINKADSIEELVSQCDYISIHIPLNDNTKNIFTEKLFSSIKPGCKLLNFSRGELIENEILKKAIDTGIIDTYVTDFPNDEIIGWDRVLTIPHLGASTPESEDNCAIMAARELRRYLKYGNIKNSVNFPDCEAPYTGKSRISVMHKNVPNMVSMITTTFAKKGINIDNMMNRSKGSWAYTLIDADDLHGSNGDMIRELESIDGVVSSRIIRKS